MFHYLPVSITFKWFLFPSLFRKYSYESHIKNCQSESKKSNQCFLVDCNFKYLLKSSLTRHLKEVHEMVIKPGECYTFKTWADFIIWKEEEECSTTSFYSQQSGQKKGYLYFYCQHDGSSKRHSKLPEGSVCKRKPRLKERVKTDDVCISMMKVHKAEDGSVQVIYFPTHSHSVEKNERHAPRKRTKKQQMELCKSKILSMNSKVMDLVQNDKVPHQFLSRVEEVLSKLLSECRSEVDSQLKTTQSESNSNTNEAENSTTSTAKPCSISLLENSSNNSNKVYINNQSVVESSISVEKQTGETWNPTFELRSEVIAISRY